MPGDVFPHPANNPNDITETVNKDNNFFFICYLLNWIFINFKAQIYLSMIKIFYNFFFIC
ncbi:hypothetical protein CNEO_360030 [Clostridium neonatale]|nr:hypothetical protein CNEO_360030 [Clostridium neonatale]